jgi:hypothetical protein
MSNTAFSALGSPVSVCVVGVGSYLPEQRVSNRQMLERVDPRHPDGTPFAPDWIERHVGINERRLDFDFAAGRKRERSEGGLFDGDLALRAGRAALADAHVDPSKVDVLVHVPLGDLPRCLSKREAEEPLVIKRQFTNPINSVL